MGRAGCDILVENDKSISRSHAILRVILNEANVVRVILHLSSELEIVLRDGGEPLFILQ